MASPTNLYPQFEGPAWDEVPPHIPRAGDPGLRVVCRTPIVDIAAYAVDRSLVAFLEFAVDPGYAQPIDRVFIVTRPDQRRLGWATQLYRFAAAQGYPMELASDDALAAGEMTPDGYDFMIGRRGKQ